MLLFGIKTVYGKTVDFIELGVTQCTLSEHHTVHVCFATYHLDPIKLTVTAILTHSNRHNFMTFDDI